MAQDVNNLDSASSSEEKPAKPSPNWWFVLSALPFGFFFQIAATTSFNSAISEATVLSVSVIDCFILVRAIIGLIWQPHSTDWRWYLLFLPASVPLIWFLGSLGSALAR